LQTTPKILGLHVDIATITDQKPQEYKASSFMSPGYQYSGILLTFFFFFFFFLRENPSVVLAGIILHRQKSTTLDNAITAVGLRVCVQWHHCQPLPVDVSMVTPLNKANKG